MVLEPCQLDPGIVPVKYTECYKEDTDNPWCYTQTYRNRSGRLGVWGYCSQECAVQTVRSVPSIFVGKYFYIF